MSVTLLPVAFPIVATSGPIAAPPLAPAPGPPDANAPGANGAEGEAGPQGEGWIVQLTGHHFHNPERAGTNQGAQFVRDTLMTALHGNKVLLPIGDREGVELVSVKELGISYPVLVNLGIVHEVELEDPNFDSDEEGMGEGAGMGRTARGPGGAMGSGGTAARKMIKLRRFDFVVQFCWQLTPPTKRHDKKAEEEGESAEGEGMGNEQ